MEDDPVAFGDDVDSVGISNPDKVLWPEADISKQDLAHFYERIGERLLVQLRNRPVTLNHHPRGVEQPGFMRKDLASHAPDYVNRWTVWAPTAKRDVTYAVIDNHAALQWCASQNVTEFHPCLFRIDAPDRLDTVVIDLDPAHGSVDAAAAALWVREVLDDVGLSSWVKTSGGRGLHILLPVEREYPTTDLRKLANSVAAATVKRHPDHVTTEFRIGDRSEKLFIDCTRVGVGATLIAAWSPRATPEATVATPLEWSEVTPGLEPAAYNQFTVENRSMPAVVIPQRIERAQRVLATLT